MDIESAPFPHIMAWIPVFLLLQAILIVEQLGGLSGMSISGRGSVKTVSLTGVVEGEKAGVAIFDGGGLKGEEADDAASI